LRPSFEARKSAHLKVLAALAASLEGGWSVVAAILRGSQALAPQDDGLPVRTLAKTKSPAQRGLDDAKVRVNRLKLLNEIRAATRAVADFSKIQD
jgi:hypothetical protein